MKPTDLDDPTPLEPDDDLLERVRTRSRSFRRRHGYQRSLTVVSGVVVLALAVGIAFTLGTNKNRVSTLVATQTTTTTTIAPTPTAVTRDTLVGSWRPVSVAGYTEPLLGQMAFGDSGSWTGDDGCNRASGTYELGSAGRFHLVGGPRTLKGCTDAKTGREIGTPFPFAATRVDLVDGRLTFFAGDGRQLAQYEREKISARVELAAPALAGGATMTGRVFVTNNTGRQVPAIRCGDYFQVLLTNADVHQDPAWAACAQPFAIPVGESSYPVTVVASYLGCSMGAAQGSLPACLANNDAPPLPPGEYQAKLFQSGDAVSIPAPITVRVLSSP